MVQALSRRAEEERERAAEEAKALTDRAEDENPGLYRRDKLWMPHAPGVAVIRGHLLVDVASFFGNCDITVREHNAPTTNRSLQGKGRDIVEASEDKETNQVFMRWYDQVQVQIDKFYPPPDTNDVENPGEGTLCGMRGAHGNAMCGLILFLGTTGEPGAGRVDKQCKYWFYSDLGFPGKNIWDIGDTPFRMVRVPTEPAPDIYEVMLRFNLKRGKKTAEHFRDNFKKNVQSWTVRHTLFEGFDWGSLQNVSPEPSVDDEPELPDPADSGEDSDLTDLSDMSAACERRFAEAQARVGRANTLVEAQAAFERGMAEDQADRERGFAEDRAADSEGITKAMADRDRRHAVRAAREGKRKAEIQPTDERGHAEAAEENEESQTESGGTMVPEEEGDSEGEPRRDITRLAPEFLRRGGKL